MFSSFPISIDSAVCAVKDAAVYYGCSTDRVIQILKKKRAVPLSTGAILFLYCKKGRPRFIGITSLSLDRMDCLPYLQGGEYPYEVYIDGRHVKSFPRLFMASQYIDHMTRVLDACRTICCVDNKSGVVHSKWYNSGDGSWSSKKTVT